MIVLGIESSCDETSAAVVTGGVIRSNVVSSQLKLHAEYGGVVPELATREHLRNLIPVAQAALHQAGVVPGELTAIAATQGPGLPNALLIGLKAAQGMAFALEKPFIGVHHHEAHLYSSWIQGDPPALCASEVRPSIGLIVSGGHTLLVHVRGFLDHRVLGGTVDDAAGECFDKSAKLVGLPYPGGPVLDKLAREGNPGRYPLPRPMLHDPSDDFSFSGLKTAVRYLLRDHPEIAADRTSLCDLCASVQAAIVEVLVTKALRAAKRLNVRCVTAAGGVTCNSGLRKQLQEGCAQNGFELRLADPTLCTDNAGMIAALGEAKLKHGLVSISLDAEPIPNWLLERVILR